MTLVASMKKNVEGYWDYLKSEDPYNCAILDGKATPEMVTRFLVDVHYLVEHTPIHLARAAKVAKKRGAHELQAYFKHKSGEEAGHDKWAEDDLATVRRAMNAPKTANVSSEMQHLVKHIEATIDADPFLYLSYIFFAEYLCVIYGPVMTQALEQKCGFPSHSMTVVENHAVLDQDHVHEWETVIPSLVDEAEYEARFLESLQKTIALHKKFFLACAKGQLHAAA